jgi:hypothetical protein
MVYSERPHEALAMATPASFYAPSAKHFSDKLERDQYPFDVERALVDRHGRIKWQNRRVFIAQALSHQLVELRPTRQRRRWALSFGPVMLGHYDERAKKARLVPSAKPRRVSAMS